MKKIIGCVLSAAIVLLFAAGCGKTAQTQQTVDLTKVMTAISEKANMPVETLELKTSDDLMDYYGIDSSLVSSFAITINASGYQDEIVMLEGKDAASTESIKTALQTHLDDSIEAMRDYSPEQCEILQKSSVNVNGNYVSLFVSADSATMQDVYNSFFTK